MNLAMQSAHMCKMAERWNGRMVDWKNGRMANGRTVDGGMAERQNDRISQRIDSGTEST